MAPLGRSTREVFIRNKIRSLRKTAEDMYRIFEDSPNERQVAGLADFPDDVWRVLMLCLRHPNDDRPILAVI